MRLSLRAGRLDWREATAGLDTAKILEWKAFWSLEPFGDEWRQTARITAWLAANATKTWHDEETFMPSSPKSAIPQTVDEIEAALQLVFPPK